jgi:hypothetical protein
MERCYSKTKSADIKNRNSLFAKDAPAIIKDLIYFIIKGSTVKLILLLSALSNSVFVYSKNPENPSSKPANWPQSVLSGCTPAKSSTELQLNNVRTLIHTGGDMWWDLVQTPRYEIPKGSGKHSLFAGALWMGGLDVNGQLKLAAQMYRTTGVDYWTGPLSKNFASTDANTCAKWDKHFVITRAQVDEFIAWFNASQTPDPSDDAEFIGYQIPEIILNWPAHGDVAAGQDYYLAPFFDRNGDGTYNPYDGDYPLYDVNNSIDCKTDRTERLYGDQTLWWIFNDKGNVHTETGGSPIGMEIHAQAFAFATNDEINNMTFYNYRLINRSTFTLTNTYFGVFTDPDLGLYNDDFVGCDVGRGLGYCYNGNEVDGTGGVNQYGIQPPAIGVDFFEGPYQDNDGIDNAFGIGFNEALNGLGYGDGIVDNERFGMRRFVYFNNDASVIGNPVTAADYYNYLRGFWKDGTKMVYGGNGHISDPKADINTPCDFMFPADSDQQYNWGTQGKPMPYWSEESEGNLPLDRRFVQSAGPFVLQPGAVNDITVGVVWARATSGGPFASVAKLKAADDKAQALFENCFRVLNGPDAPNVKIVELNRELILHISNVAGSNNFNEQYEEVDPQIPEFVIDVNTNYVLDPLTGQYNQVVTKDTVYNDRKYRFQGYQIFQLKDATVSPEELYNPDRARLVAQCDLKDSVAQLVNFDFNEEINANIPQEMVNGQNQGIRHTFRITEDKFAANDKRLVNHKTYYYMAIAYGYNSFKKYDPNDPMQLDGQKKPYKQSRKSLTGAIRSYAGVPHITSPGGLQINSEYGEGPFITRLEGTGNGGRAVSMTEESEREVFEKVNVGKVTYQKGKGPVNVYVVDPLVVPDAEFELRFNVIGNAVDTARWTLKNLTTGEEVKSDRTITVGNEQIIPKWGLAVFITQSKNAGKEPNDGNGFIESTITFADAGKRWLTGVSDADGASERNWIRSGTFTDPNIGVYNDYLNKDPKEVYEKVVNGWWAPYSLVSYPQVANNQTYNASGPGLNALTINLANLNFIKSVDIVITADKSKWTRCCVIENNAFTNLAQGGAVKNMLRKAPSVTKSGQPDGTGTMGMGWFPGYAICQETGQRLNMAFSEDSWLAADNGRDMIWNPSSTELSQLFDPIYGAKHFIYVFDNNGTGPNDMPAYDEGKWMYERLTAAAANANPATTPDARNVWRSCMWVGWPLLEKDQKLLDTDVRISIKVNREYARYDTGNNENDRWPLYRFDTRDMAVVHKNQALSEDALQLINVVPNPYYAFSEYEKNQLDNRIKIVNLPQECQVSIYTMNGTLVRRFNKADSKTSLDWDLKNQANIPVASGIYLIHVDVPGVGQKVVKWYGVMRPVDLDTF